MMVMMMMVTMMMMMMLILITRACQIVVRVRPRGRGILENFFSDK